MTMRHVREPDPSGKDTPQSDIDARLAAKVHRLRKCRGWSRSEFGRRLGVGVHVVQRWECFGAPILAHFIPKMAQLFDMPIDDLFDEGAKAKLHRPHDPAVQEMLEAAAGIPEPAFREALLLLSRAMTLPHQ
ncbi:MAG: helix-turn-helix domain-containing protein [Geminicoccaceae bacterium]